MNLFVIVLFSFTLALHLFLLDATFMALLGRPSIWEAEHHLEVDYETCCQEMCRANDSCKSYDQTWQPWRDIYECRFYSKNYQVLKAEGGTLELLPRVQYFSKMYKDFTGCKDWWQKTGARKKGHYQLKDGSMKLCFAFKSCDEVTNRGYLKSGEAWFEVFVEYKPVRLLCRVYGSKGWTVFQKRSNPTKYPFHKKSWQEYKEGFKESDDDFWLGLRHLNVMTKSKDKELIVGALHGDSWRGAGYKEFFVAKEEYAFSLKATNDYYKPTSKEIFDRSFLVSMEYRSRFATHDNDSSRDECMSKFDGEGTAGWIQGSETCDSAYTFFPNGKQPKRLILKGKTEVYKESFMMFREKDTP